MLGGALVAAVVATIFVRGMLAGTSLQTRRRSAGGDGPPRPGPLDRDACHYGLGGWTLLTGTTTSHGQTGREGPSPWLPLPKLEYGHPREARRDEVERRWACVTSR